MLSYDWVKIILTIAGLIVVWAFIFSATSTKITAAQQFSVYNYRGNNNLSREFYDNLEKGFKKDNIFSYEVIETDPYDFVTVGKDTNTVLTARSGVGEGDVIFLSPEFDTNTQYKEEGTDEIKYKSTYAQTFTQNYYYNIFHFDQNEDGSFTEDSFFGQMESYLSPFFDGDLKNGTLNEKKAEEHFRARIKKNGDKRFKTKKQIEQGIEWENERLNKYRDALLETYGYFEEGLIKTESYTIADAFDETKKITHAYTLNICPNEKKAENLKNIVSYQTTYTDENGETQPKNTAENMNVAFFNYPKYVEKGFAYESLLYINFVIRSSLTA